jgi:tetratricopeptide (TPR) repeat protein
VRRRLAGRAAALAAALALAAGPAACGGRSDHEALGDRAYGEARYADAMAEYLEAARSVSRPDGWAKLGAAALHAGELRQSTEAYLKLAELDPARRAEAAEGLDGVARAAERANNPDVLQEAVTGLTAVEPSRSTGRYALALARGADADTAELVALLPSALAAASSAQQEDSLLLRYGRALQTSEGCGQALLQFRAALRRSQDSSTRAGARQGAAECALALGVRADSARRTEEAALWYAEAARVDSTTPIGRAALLRYGAARLAQGDTLAAAMAFQTLVAAGTDDSTGQAAAAGLSSIGTITPADTTGTGAR